MTQFGKVIFVSTALTISSSFAYAATLTARASVEIVEPTNFLQLSPLDIDGIKIPDDGEFIISINKPAASSNSSGSDKKPKKTVHIIKNVSGGEYVISGLKGDSIQISANNSANIEGIYLDSFSVNYKGNQVSLPSVAQNSPGKNAKMKLGADLKIASLTKAGFHKPKIELDISYE